MSLLFLAACSSPAPPAEKPAPPERSLHEGRLAALRRAMGRAAKGDDEACTAIQTALELAPELDAARRSGSLDWDALQTDAPGLHLAADRIAVDYRELSLAVGPGPASTALVTVGGAIVGGCVDPERLSRWLIRGPTVSKAPSCMVDSLREALSDAIQAQLEAPCLCAVPEADPIPTLVARLEAIELDELAQKARAWPESPTWKACEAPEPASGD